MAIKKGKLVIISVHARNELLQMSVRIEQLAAVYRQELTDAAEYNGYGQPEDDEYRHEMTSAARTLQDIANLTYSGKWWEQDDS